MNFGILSTPGGMVRKYVTATDNIIYRAPIGNYGKKLSWQLISNTSDAEWFALKVTSIDGSVIYEQIQYSCRQRTFTFDTDIKTFEFYVLLDGYVLYSEGDVECVIGYGDWAEQEHTKSLTGKGLHHPSIVFTPYYEEIRSCQLMRLDGGQNNENQFRLFVTGRSGITFVQDIMITYGIRFVETRYGEITIYERPHLTKLLPAGMSMELPIVHRLDVAATSLGFYHIDNVLTDRWFPSYNGLCSERIGECAIPLDIKETWEGYVHAQQYVPLYMSSLFVSDPTVPGNFDNCLNIDFLNNLFSRAQTAGIRIGLLLMPTTQSSRQSANINNGIYYHFPTWFLESLLINNPYQPYPITRSDPYVGDEIQVYVIDWRSNVAKGVYMACMSRLHNYFVEHPEYYKHVDYVKVGFAGAWGEGTDMHIPKADYPSAQDFITLSESTCNAFPGKPCIVSLISALNFEFPIEYSQYILNSDHGLFYDGADVPPRSMFLEMPAIHSGSTLDKMNKAFQKCSNQFVYVESAQELSHSNIPSYASLEAYAKYFKPDFYSLSNVYFDAGAAIYNHNLNLSDSIRRLSHYVGTRLYILGYDVEMTNSSLYVDVIIGNYGTAKVREYWKLQVIVKSRSDEKYYDIDDEDQNISMVPKPFEAGVPNPHDCVRFQKTWSIMPVFPMNTIVDVLIAVVDRESIYKPLPFCNTTESLPREMTEGSLTGRFYLKTNTCLGSN